MIAGAQVDRWQTISFGDKRKAFSLDFCSAVMMRVDEDSVDSVADEGGDDHDDDDGDEGQDDEDEEDEDGDEEKAGDDECDGDEPQRSRRLR